MSSLFSYIVWSIDPDMFVIPGLNHPVRWYGLLFAGGFIVSQQIMYYIFRKEGKSEKDIDILTVHMILATVIGARLGHVLFYGPWWDSFNAAGQLVREGYFSHPIKILYIWEGGLASHGGAIGIFISVWLYSNYDIRMKFFPIIKGYFGIPYKVTSKKQKRKGQSFAYMLDRLVIVVALTGAMIRTGNFTNSEMIGIPTNSDYGIVFARDAEDNFMRRNRNLESVEFSASETRVNLGPGLVPIDITFYFEKGARISEPDLISFIEGPVKTYLSQEMSDDTHVFYPENQKLSRDISQKRRQYIVKTEAYGVNRHPAQLYEALYCVLIFLGMFHIWYHHRHQLPEGFMIGLFLVVLWSLRFVDEFFKINQVPFEDNIPLNMGQWLSVPFIIIGALVMIISMKRGKRPEPQES